MNGEIIDFFIGDFNYLFDSSNNDDLSLGNLKATVMDTDSKKSISGLMISLTNNTTNSIIINEIQLGNDKVTLNNDYSIEMNREVDMFEEVEDILLKDYNNLSKQFNPNTHSIRSKEEKAFYIPVRFDEQHLFIHRTYIKISYNYRGVDKVLYLDDFPFINTSIFERGYIDGFNYYEYQDK